MKASLLVEVKKSI